MAWERGPYDLGGATPPQGTTLDLERGPFTLIGSNLNGMISSPPVGSGAWERGPYELFTEAPPPDDVTKQFDRGQLGLAGGAVELSFPPTGSGFWERGPYDLTGNEPTPGDKTLLMEHGSLTLVGTDADLMITGGPPVVSPITQYLESGVFALSGFDLILAIAALQQFDLGEFTLGGSDLEGTTIYPELTYPLNAGSGTLVRCVEFPEASGTVDENDWDTTPYNNKRWPINEGTGALLNEVLTGDDTYDATIQNYTDNWT